MNIDDLIKQNEVLPSYLDDMHYNEEERKYLLKMQNEYILKTIPLEVRRAIIYLPLMLIDNAMRLMEDVRDIMAISYKLKKMRYVADETDKKNRVILDDIKEFLKVYHKCLHKDLGYNTKKLRDNAGEFYLEISKTIISYRNAYIEEMRRQGADSDDNTLTLISTLYIVKEFTILKSEYEEDLCGKMNKYLKGTSISFRKSPSIWESELRSRADKILQIFHAPEQLKSQQIDLCKLIIKNKIDKLDLEELTDIDDGNFRYIDD